MSHAVLAQLAEEVERGQREVEEAAAQVSAARAAQESRERTLNERAQQALRYAQVYADSDRELKAELDALGFPDKPAREPRPGAKRPRGSRKSKPSASPPLFDEAPVAAE